MEVGGHPVWRGEKTEEENGPPFTAQRRVGVGARFISFHSRALGNAGRAGLSSPDVYSSSSPPVKLKGLQLSRRPRGSAHQSLQASGGSYQAAPHLTSTTSGEKISLWGGCTT